MSATLGEGQGIFKLNAKSAKDVSTSTCWFQSVEGVTHFNVESGSKAPTCWLPTATGKRKHVTHKCPGKSPLRFLQTWTFQQAHPALCS